MPTARRIATGDRARRGSNPHAFTRRIVGATDQQAHPTAGRNGRPTGTAPNASGHHILERRFAFERRSAARFVVSPQSRVDSIYPSPPRPRTRRRRRDDPDRGAPRPVVAHHDTGCAEQPRFGMLQTIRDFGLNESVMRGDLDATRAALAAHVLARAPESDRSRGYRSPNLARVVHPRTRQHRGIAGMVR